MSSSKKTVFTKFKETEFTNIWDSVHIGEKDPVTRVKTLDKDQLYFQCWIEGLNHYLCHMKASNDFKPSLEVPRDFFGSW